MLRWLLLFIVIAVAAWWLATPSTPARAPAATVAHTAPGCPLPAQRAGTDGVVQSDAPDATAPFAVADASARPLAGVSIAARVLSRHDYDGDREARYAPLDLALGWGRMRDDAVLSRLDISQSNRWYHYRWRDQPPLPVEEIVRSSANMHLIPASPTVAAALDTVAAGDNVHIDGWLVRIDAADGWRWRSSLSREDHGGGACELVYVCAVTTR